MNWRKRNRTQTKRSLWKTLYTQILFYCDSGRWWLQGHFSWLHCFKLILVCNVCEWKSVYVWLNICSSSEVFFDVSYLDVKTGVCLWSLHTCLDNKNRAHTFDVIGDFLTWHCCSFTRTHTQCGRTSVPRPQSYTRNSGDTFSQWSETFPELF